MRIPATTCVSLLRFHVKVAVVVLLLNGAVNVPLNAQFDVRLNRVNQASTVDELHELLERYDRAAGAVISTTGENNFYYIAGRYGEAVSKYLDGDLNLDGRVDLEDMAVHWHNFGHSNYFPQPNVAPSESLTVSLDTDNSIIVSTSEPLEIGGLEFWSPSGSLVPLEALVRADPFRAERYVLREPAQMTDASRGPKWVLSNTPDQVSLMADPGWHMTIDGQFDTGIVANDADLEVRWFERGSVQTGSQRIGGAPPVGTHLPVLPVSPGFEERTNFFGGPPDEVRGALPVTEFVEVKEPASLTELLREFDVPRGDIDGDGSITSVDIDEYWKNYPLGVSSYAQGDVNLDGFATLEDLAIMHANFGDSGFVPQRDRRIRGTTQLAVDVDESGSVVIRIPEVVELAGLEIFTAGGTGFRRLGNSKLTPVNDLFDIRLPAGRGSTLNFGWSAELGESVTLEAGSITLPMLRALGDDIVLRWFEPGSSLITSHTLGDPVLPGDLDGNGMVDFTDFLTLSQNFGLETTNTFDGDIDQNGIVDFEDFVTLSGNFGQSIGPPPNAIAMVPEPKSMWQLAVLFLVLSGVWHGKSRVDRGVRRSRGCNLAGDGFASG